MNPQWSWDTKTADWGVELNTATGVLRWWGADHPRPGVPAYAAGGGQVDQTVADLLASGRPGYSCPPDVLQQVLEAARAWQAQHPQ